ncbi:hypothetical protein VTN77DRAFT_5385 [Rasamsonia byssochlamydoides]|uniref:uncharacterized protein n=1 Tax=Rasamsonia byssochlamydoides TaxID=89139 RepID=UPI003743DC89
MLDTSIFCAYDAKSVIEYKGSGSSNEGLLEMICSLPTLRPSAPSAGMDEDQHSNVKVSLNSSHLVDLFLLRNQSEAAYQHRHVYLSKKDTA